MIACALYVKLCFLCTNISMDFIIRDHYPLTLQTQGMSEALYLAVMTSCVLYRLRNAGSVK